MTGAAGFIGSSIARRLLDDGHSVVGVDAMTDYYDRQLKRDNLKRLTGAGFRFVESDLNVVDLDALLSGVDVIFHQAGQPGVRGSWGSDFDVYVDRNIRATQRLLEAAKRAGTIRRFVYASSSSVYGDAESYPTREQDATWPKSPYGVSKLAGEHLVGLYARNFGLPTTSLRYFTVYGPRQRPDMAFTRFLRSAIRGDSVRLFGTGAQVRDFTYIDDIVEANVLAISVDHAPGSVFNLSGGSNVSVNEVLAAIGEIAGRPLHVLRTAGSPGDVMRTSGSTDEVSAVLGWAPSTVLLDGLKQQHEWLLETRELWDGVPQNWD